MIMVMIIYSETQCLAATSSLQPLDLAAWQKLQYIILVKKTLVNMVTH